MQGELAYATKENFLGRVVDGYLPDASRVCLLTRKAAEQLCLVQSALNRRGMGLFIFDALRPLRAVRDFGTWYGEPIQTAFEAHRKQLHFPHLDKPDLVRLGYAPDSISRHCFGHVVDLSLIDLRTNELLDMGTIFDYFDVTSHHPEASADVIGEVAFRNRQILTDTMEAFGFLGYAKEYWHFDYKETELVDPVDMEITSDLLGLGCSR